MPNQGKENSNYSDEFMEQLEQSSQIISRWPDWKKSALCSLVLEQNHFYEKEETLEIDKS